MNYASLILRHLADDKSTFHTCNAPKSDLNEAADYIESLEFLAQDRLLTIHKLQKEVAILQSKLKT